MEAVEAAWERYAYEEVKGLLGSEDGGWTGEEERKGKYLLGLALWHEPGGGAQQVDEGRKLLEEVKAGGGALGWLACFHLGRMAELRDYAGDEPDLDMAMSYYEEVMAGADDALRHPSALFAGAIKLRIEGYEEGRVFLEEWLASEPVHALAAAKWELLAQAAAGAGAPEEALGYYDRAWEAGFANRNQAAANLWRMGALASEHGQTGRARTYWEAIVDEHPMSGFKWDAQRRLKATMEASK